jgi:hypothetical protein
MVSILFNLYLTNTYRYHSIRYPSSNPSILYERRVIRLNISDFDFILILIKIMNTKEETYTAPILWYVGPRPIISMIHTSPMASAIDIDSPSEAYP